MKKTVKCAILLSSLFWISAFASCSVSDDNPAAGTGQSSFANSASSDSGTGGGSGTNGESTSGNNQNGTSGSGTNNGNNGNNSSSGNPNQGNNGNNSSNSDSGNQDSTSIPKTVTNYLFSSETGTSDINATIIDWGNGGSHSVETVSGIGKVLKLTTGTGWNGESALCLPFQIRSLASYESLSFKIYVSDMTVTNPAKDKDILVKIPEEEISFALSEYGEAISGKSGWYKITVPLNLPQWASVRTSENRIAVLQRCTGSLKITDIALTKTETASNPNKPQAEATGAYRNGMSIVWQDEFDSSDPDGTPLSDKWGYDVGRGQSENSDGTNPGNWAWGNNEIQWYSDNDRDNTYVSDGTLKIVAKKENAPGDTTWTSGRLVTRNIYENKYGCIEMRAKITEARGMWPAFWMLRHDIYDEGGTGWPKGGEIDIMESSTSIWGPGKVYGTLHCDAGSGGNPIFTKGTVLSSLDENWHTYAVVWNENGTISWYYDDILLGTYTAADKNNNACWPYDENFYIILNLAVGGNLGGAIDPNLTQAVMEVDYVRWYK